MADSVVPVDGKRSSQTDPGLIGIEEDFRQLGRRGTRTDCERGLSGSVRVWSASRLVCPGLRSDRANPLTRRALRAKVNRLLDYTRSLDRLLSLIDAKGESRFTRIS